MISDALLYSGGGWERIVIKLLSKLRSLPKSHERNQICLSTHGQVTFSKLGTSTISDFYICTLTSQCLSISSIVKSVIIISNSLWSWVWIHQSQTLHDLAIWKQMWLPFFNGKYQQQGPWFKVRGPCMVK